MRDKRFDFFICFKNNNNFGYLDTNCKDVY